MELGIIHTCRIWIGIYIDIKDLGIGYVFSQIIIGFDGKKKLTRRCIYINYAVADPNNTNSL